MLQAAYAKQTNDVTDTKTALRAAGKELVELQEACAAAKADNKKDQDALAQQLKKSKDAAKALAASQAAIEARHAKSKAALRAVHDKVLIEKSTRVRT